MSRRYPCERPRTPPPPRHGRHYREEEQYDNYGGEEQEPDLRHVLQNWRGDKGGRREQSYDRYQDQYNDDYHYDYQRPQRGRGGRGRRRGGGGYRGRPPHTRRYPSPPRNYSRSRSPPRDLASRSPSPVVPTTRPRFVEDDRPASPVTLEEDKEEQRRKEEERKARKEQREREDRERKEQDERDRAAIAMSMDDLEEVDDIAIREDDRASLGSLPSIEEKAQGDDDDEEEHIGSLFDGLEEVDSIAIREDDAASLGSLPSVEGGFGREPAPPGEDDLGGGDRPSSRGSRHFESVDRRSNSRSREWVSRDRDSQWSRERSRSREQRRSWSRDRDYHHHQQHQRDVRQQRPPRRHPPPPPEDFEPRQKQQPKPKPCYVCKSFDHKAKECPDLVCYKCQEGGHFAKECENEPVPQKKPMQRQRHYEEERHDGYKPPGREVHDNDDYGQFQGSSSSFQHQSRISPPAAQQGKPVKSESVKALLTCYNCKNVGHHIKDCPSLYCKKCGGKGHFAKECHQGAAPAIPPAPVIGSIIGGGGGGSWAAGPNGWTKPTVCLQEHFSQKLAQRGQEVRLAKQMVETWRQVGHTEDTLWGLFRRENPSDKNSWRMSLIREISHMQRSHVKPLVDVTQLLNDTVDYHMPGDGDGGGDGACPASSPASARRRCSCRRRSSWRRR